MTVDDGTTPSVLWPLPAVAGLVALAGLGMLLAITFGGGVWMGVLTVVTIDGVHAAWIVLAAGGLGWAGVGWLLPKDAPTALRTFTEIGVGLALLGVVVMLAGWFVPGGLDAWRWLVLLSAAAVLSLWPIARWLTSFSDDESAGLREKLDDLHIPWRVRRAQLWWILPAIAAAIWLSGAAFPAGLIGSGDDIRSVLQVHLQLPREYLHRGSTLPLAHNVHSHRPCSVEMLSLLAMIIRGGGWEGMYVAKLLHGIFGVMAVGVVWASLPRSTNRSRYAAVLLAGSPIVLYLSWMAKIELAGVFAAALAVAWLRIFSRRPSAGASIAIGLACGIAVSTSYLAAATVAGPVLAAMLLIALWPSSRRPPARSDELNVDPNDLPHGAPLPAKLLGLVLAGAVVAPAAIPWLARTHAATGNPVFPHATQTFGAGPWGQVQVHRRQQAHQPGPQPPVPLPTGESTETSSAPPKAVLLARRFATTEGLDWLGLALVLLAVGGAAVAIVSRRRRTPWNIALVTLVVLQISTWAMLTRTLPPAALAPALVPLAWLAALAADHARLTLQRLLGGKVSPDTPEKDIRMVARVAAIIPAVAIVLGASMGLAGALQTYPAATRGLRIHGIDGEDIAKTAAPWSLAHQLPSNSKLLLIGQDDPYHFPPDTLYATGWDVHPLERLVARYPDSPEAILRGLRNLEVTHIWVNWSRLETLARTTGYPAVLQADQRARLAEGKPIGLDILDTLMRHGLDPIGGVGPDGLLRPGSVEGPPPSISIYRLPALRR
ncbi:MAG: ArnT family glycosyltransferase [Phycisphaerae bacterium]